MVRDKLSWIEKVIISMIVIRYMIHFYGLLFSDAKMNEYLLAGTKGAFIFDGVIFIILSMYTFIKLKNKEKLASTKTDNKFIISNYFSVIIIALDMFYS